MEMTNTQQTMMSHGMTDTLFDVNDATHVAIRSGAWTDPSTWQGGRIPNDGAMVHIPMGVDVAYDSMSTARLEVVRVDGALDFSTTTDTHMLVESVYTGQMSRLTIGTADNPVNEDVTAKMIFADGKIDLSLDPDQIGHGLVAEGRVEIHGTEKAPYTFLEGTALAGANSLTLNAAQGWSVGDTVVVMGTKLGEFQDEYRVITSIHEGVNGVFAQLDSPLDYDHTSPDGHDLKIYVGNSTRNIELSSENPEGVRGHVMMMHTPDVSIQFAEFTELGRTDKSLPLDVNGNVAGRYSLHLHETGTDVDSQMAVIYGNSVHGSPGWGITQHSSNAAIDFNFVHDIDGAGIVSEDGNEIGQWIGNFVTGVAGTGSKFSIQRDELDADFGHSGVAYENQARQIVQQNNIAANANTGWMFRAAEASVDNPDRDALQFDPAPFKAVINNEEPAIIGFHDNTAIAIETVVDTGHRQGVSTVTDLRSDMIGLTAWEVSRVFDIFSYTGEYVIRDGLFIGAEDGAGRAIRMPDKHESTSIINTHFENFSTAIYDAGINNDGVYVGLTFQNVKNKIDADAYNDSRIQSFSDIDIVDKPKLSIDSSSDLTMGQGDHELYISGTITDSAGTLRLGSNRWTSTITSDHDAIDTTAGVLGNPEPEELIAIHGALRVGGEWIMPVAIWITDRVTGEHFAYRIDIKLVGYSDSYLEQFEIAKFVMPSNEIKVVDSYEFSHSGESQSVAPQRPAEQPTDDGTSDEPDAPDDKIVVGSPILLEQEPKIPATLTPEPETGGGVDTDDVVVPLDDEVSADPVVETGENGWALTLGRTGVDIPVIKLNDDFTISAWVNLAEGKNISIADAIVGSDDFDINFNNGRLTVSFGKDAAAISTKAAVDGVWTHYTVVRDSGIIKIFEDGEQVGSSDKNWTAAIEINKLGDGQVMSRGLVGVIDEVGIWDTAHNQEQITDVFLGGVAAASVSAPIAAYDFEDGIDLGNGTQLTQSGVRAAVNPDELDKPDTVVDISEADVMELGHVSVKQKDSSEWSSVTFTTEIDNAVVIMGPVSNNGSQAGFARVRNVTDEGFEYHIEEWDYLDGKHTTEEISWMAISEGTHTLPDGRVISAASFMTDALGSTSIDFDVSAIMLAQVGSDSNEEAVIARTNTLDDNGLAVEIQRQEDSSGPLNAEKVFVVGITPNEADNFVFASGVFDGLNHKKSEIAFDSNFDDVAFLGSVSSRNDGDTVALRLDDLGSNSASVFLQEEKSQDAETAHGNEQISWFAGEVGVYELA